LSSILNLNVLRFFTFKNKLVDDKYSIIEEEDIDVLEYLFASLFFNQTATNKKEGVFCTAV
ncbi:hypothetical protein ACJX0J_024213, partial [Zea mays]